MASAILLGRLRPNGDNKAQWTEEPVGTAYTTVDEAVNVPTVPTLTDYFTSSTSGQVCTLDFGTVTLTAGRAPHAFLIYVYGEVSGGPITAAAIAPKTITTASVTGAAGWYTNSNSKQFAAMTQSEIDALQVTFGAPASGTGTIYATYLAIYERDIMTGPMMGVW